MNSEKELTLIRDYITLPIAITIVNKNRIELKESQYTLRSLYAATATVIINKMRNDLETIRRQLNELHISVINTKEKKDEDSVYFPYLYRGQRCEFTLEREVAKQDIRTKLNNYINEVIKI
ncbi:hypothetical protein [Paenibacillus rigui]|uniref:Uncharacterized protein n=1 Tax=Paenibacillus rigui TaxID=554312 RepID=A0A229UMP0_9BACL|nr:hypothetical protein [Paenibacillus rigui]OXM84623.1 hypothetical protein CF651_19140 [Paenibacillus rigui]